MDEVSSEQSRLDSLSLLLPLPYRIAVLFVLGLWAWAVNLHAFSTTRIDIASLINYSPQTATGNKSYHLRAYRLAATLSIPLAGSLLLFWAITRKRVDSVLAWDILPQSYLVIGALIFILPLQRFSRAGRYRFLSTLKRVSVGGIAKAQYGKFGDILLADVLTSYAKVLGDLFASTCMFFSQGKSSTAKPDRSCGGGFVIPLIIALPSLIRLRQCLIEYNRVRKSVRSGGSINSGWGGQHLANALKYSTAFPVIVLSSLQRSKGNSDLRISEELLFKLWIASVLVNSLYSFYWDVSKDWDLSLFSHTRVRNNPEHPWGLRQNLYFQNVRVYYAAILGDLLLRCTWSLKLSPHLDHLNDLEAGIFVMELLEVFRRWIWIFLRVETEWIRSSRGPVTEDLLLGSYRTRLELE